MNNEQGSIVNEQSTMNYEEASIIN